MPIISGWSPISALKIASIYPVGEEGAGHGFSFPAFALLGNASCLISLPKVIGTTARSCDGMGIPTARIDNERSAVVGSPLTLIIHMLRQSPRAPAFATSLINEIRGKKKFPSCLPNTLLYSTDLSPPLATSTHTRRPMTYQTCAWHMFRPTPRRRLRNRQRLSPCQAGTLSGRQHMVNVLM